MSIFGKIGRLIKNNLPLLTVILGSFLASFLLFFITLNPVLAVIALFLPLLLYFSIEKYRLVWYFILLSLFFMGNTSIAFGISWSEIGLFCLALISWLKLSSEKINLFKNPIFWLFLLISILSLSHYLFRFFTQTSNNQELTKISLSFFCYGILATFAGRFFRSKNDRSLLLKTIFYSGLFLSIIEFFKNLPTAGSKIGMFFSLAKGQETGNVIPVVIDSGFDFHSNSILIGISIIAGVSMVLINHQRKLTLNWIKLPWSNFYFFIVFELLVLLIKGEKMLVLTLIFSVLWMLILSRIKKAVLILVSVFGLLIATNEKFILKAIEKALPFKDFFSSTFVASEKISSGFFVIWNVAGILTLLIFLLILKTQFSRIYYSYRTSDGEKRAWLIGLIGLFIFFLIGGFFSANIIFGPASFLFWTLFGLCPVLENFQAVRLMSRSSFFNKSVVLIKSLF